MNKEVLLHISPTYNDEILDIALVGVDNSLVAVATNREQARIFTLNCQILSGHTGMVYVL